MILVFGVKSYMKIMTSRNKKKHYPVILNLNNKEYGRR